MTHTLPDVIAYDLAVLFCGLNPGASSAAAGRNFANRSNRFWRTIHEAGFTPRLLGSEEDENLVQYGIGLTTAVARPTRRADEVSTAEFRAAVAPLREKIERFRPRVVAFLGKAAYAAVVERRDFTWGAQPERFGGALAWVVPNPSGLNRGFTLAQLVAAYAALRAAATEAHVS